MKKLSEYLKKPLCTCHWGKRFLYHNQIISVFHLPNSTYHSTVGAVSFNAFHVPIYLTSKKHHVVKRYFKYISCSYLSQRHTARWVKRNNIQIHLMFLFIVQYLCYPIFFAHSNTSHVLIYLRRYGGIHGCAKIQIHLMFLFIKQTT